MNYTSLTRMPDNSVLIYKIENKANGHCYVGSTVEPMRRWSAHKKNLQLNKHTSPFLQQAWNKHKEENFMFIPLMVCNTPNRALYEDIAIKAMGYYNFLKVSCMPQPGAMRNKKHTAVGRKNLSTGATRRWAETRQKVYDPLCAKAWELVVQGTPRYKACKIIGVSHSTFWIWLAKNHKLQGVRGRFKQPEN